SAPADDVAEDDGAALAEALREGDADEPDWDAMRAELSGIGAAEPGEAPAPVGTAHAEVAATATPPEATAAAAWAHEDIITDPGWPLPGDLDGDWATTEPGQAAPQPSAGPQADAGWLGATPAPAPGDDADGDGWFGAAEPLVAAAAEDGTEVTVTDARWDDGLTAEIPVVAPAGDVAGPEDPAIGEGWEPPEVAWEGADASAEDVADGPVAGAASDAAAGGWDVDDVIGAADPAGTVEPGDGEWLGGDARAVAVEAPGGWAAPVHPEAEAWIAEDDDPGWNASPVVPEWGDPDAAAPDPPDPAAPTHEEPPAAAAQGEADGWPVAGAPEWEPDGAHDATPAPSGASVAGPDPDLAEDAAPWPAPVTAAAETAAAAAAAPAPVAPVARADADDARTGRFSIGGMALGEGHEAIAAVTFRRGLPDAPVAWALEDGRAHAPGTLVLEVQATMNCRAEDVLVMFEPGFAPSPEAFTLRLSALAAGPFAASGTFRVVAG
ncbi:MAG TPA: hypothetical protein VNT51_01930, partial [Miltoncostaeaceae bacterium]|nr:hypothetical protein [Miltoncostaeaceae bacterium]